MRCVSSRGSDDYKDVADSLSKVYLHAFDEKLTIQFSMAPSRLLKYTPKFAPRFSDEAAIGFF